ncbi:DEAD/DEAH box helicase family protein [Autumnicola musiva]|uniref:DEAD/DEAH box helicase family protein n=1 Tax=Autumnicola musiva TaxID=3075589 RepID=A0ABU3D4Z7_9FLAO|nr:DEAD/DEAH box helicase family protein [Zunongwangia sp. F117]MDT0676459.1 DEAD/DEAH box helicase family protein [Zunongwangia sp. F117]
MEYLYNTLIKEFGKREIARTKVPDSIIDNIWEKYDQRPYQLEAFKRFLLCYNEEFEGKPYKPLHLMYNMATGSGKTLVMGGLIIYLFEKGYRNFLFFVNTKNIISKTIENFLNPQASKYLFRDRIVIDGREVLIKSVDNFDEADPENINIKFTTIQQLHLDLNNSKENSITYEDFEDRKTVLIADEAHHLSSNTKKNGELFGGWEGTVLKILNTNIDNLLLEFTATLDYESREITEKYKDKVIFKYDLAEFRNDKYSKEINLVRSFYGENERILQALILNLYRQELASDHNVNLKPVILFKARRTIKESEENKQNFHLLIENLSSEIIENVKQSSTVPIVQKAFSYFKSKGLSSSELLNRIQINFKETNCISANNDAEAEKNQILLNTLEDENNPIRAIFAVQKLNEGWDVLNLFDIVRLYEGRDGKSGKPGKTTISEAQLIGRGARYFPFSVEQGQEKYKRKYDDDLTHDLRILEELFYHTKEDSRYISELKKALVETGIYEDEDNLETKQLFLKKDFKRTDFYKKGQVFFNKRIEKGRANVDSFSELGVSKKNFIHTISSGLGKITGVFNNNEEDEEETSIVSKDFPLRKMPTHIIRYALTKNPFFFFHNISKLFPSISSYSYLISNNKFLGGLEITVLGTEKRINNLTNEDLLEALERLLQALEDEIKSNLIKYQGSNFISDYVHNIFKDKEIKVAKNSERYEGQEELVAEKRWYAYNANYGTIEEKNFVSMFARRFEHLEKKYEDIYLVRNEREVKIYDYKGRAFEPDFLLFCREKDDKSLVYQVFIEPKGGHLIANDKWKEEFLMTLRKDKDILEIHSDKYAITGVPFYNNSNENDFKESLNKVLNL